MISLPLRHSRPPAKDLQASQSTGPPVNDRPYGLTSYPTGLRGPTGLILHWRCLRHNGLLRSHWSNQAVLTSCWPGRLRKRHLVKVKAILSRLPLFDNAVQKNVFESTTTFSQNPDESLAVYKEGISGFKLLKTFVLT